MNKTRIRLFSLVLAIVLLVAALPLTAFAASDGSITINNTTKDKVYDVYRIFDLTYTVTAPEEEGGEATKLYTYTMNASFENFFSSVYSITNDAQAVALVSAMASNSTELDAFAAAAKKYALENNIAPTATDTATTTTLTLEGLDLGYYLVYPQGGLTAACSLTTTDPNGTVAVKTDYPTIDKVIVEGEDELDTTTARVGDRVEFRLTTTIPDMTGYTAYTYIVNDTLSTGLTFNGDLVIEVDGAEIDLDKDYTVKTDDVSAGQQITITFIEFLTKNYELSGKDIVITYSATVNNAAVIGGSGNPNTVNLTYSNDPSVTTSTDTTPDNKVIVFTFRLDIVKVNAADATDYLENAEFSLWTTTNNGSTTTKEYKVDEDTTITLYLVADKLTTNASGQVSASVEAGTYYLFEDVAPDNFNKLDKPIVFTVAATIEDGELTSISIDNDTLSSTGGSGVINTTIENRSGLLLPSTGGRGTQLFVVCGAALMAIAGATYLIYRRKTAKAQAK